MNTINVELEIHNILKERENKFDKNFNKIAYYLELKRTEKLINDFTEKLIEQLIILVFGGNRVLLEVIPQEEAIEYLTEEVIIKKGADNIVTGLYSMYTDIMNTHTGFCHLIKQNNLFNENEIKMLIEKM